MFEGYNREANIEMKHLQFLILITFFSCGDLVGPEKNEAYLGCWKEATGKKGFFDLRISRTSEGYEVTLGEDCGLNSNLIVQNGFFEEDTLHFHNGVQEYWFHLVGDTLRYSQENSNRIERFVKLR